MKKIGIVGAGGFGREIKNLIESINRVEKKYDIIGFFDDSFKQGDIINGIPVLGNITSINSIDHPLSIVVGIGEPKIKRKIVDFIENDLVDFPSLIHPSVIISSDDVSLGIGNIICAGSIITCNIELMDFVTINLSCTVGHDTIINSFCSFMPSVNISGEVIIEEDVYVGTGAKIINKLRIGKSTIVGAGAVVAKSLPENCTAVGIPAKPIKFN